MRDLGHDPFILAAGHVALASPWFEGFVGILFKEIANTPEDRKWATGRNLSEVIKGARKQLSNLPASPLKADIIAALADCERTWTARNDVIHGSWIVNSDGHWGSRPGRKSEPATRLAGDASALLDIANDLDELGNRVTGLAQQLINQRRIELGLPSISGTVAWQVDR